MSLQCIVPPPLHSSLIFAHRPACLAWSSCCQQQLCLDPLGTEWDYPLGSKDLDGNEEPWKGGAGLPPTGCFPGPWRQDISLDCKGSPEEAEAQAWTVYYYGLLQSCLQQAGLPETQDRSQAPRTGASGLRKRVSQRQGRDLQFSCFPLSVQAGSSPRLWFHLKAKPEGLGQTGLVSKDIRSGLPTKSHPTHPAPWKSTISFAYSVELKLLERCLRRCYGCS
ncbi:uncharacterized protein LOC115063612 [Mus pahari]|uniref:uncharacterized protein LOC115063612 n=1 Tax=Mus pahari TaxID=10093 RepID=UPI001114D2DF|nr:uncharacterized protein LOC115063612 [Mus pahari]